MTETENSKGRVRLRDLWFYWLTGGRPMKRREYRFRSDLSGEPVYLYEDQFGRLWLAETPWALFRVGALYGEDYGPLP